MLADPILTEHYAKAGLGAVLVDMQHGLLDERTAFECIQRLEKFPNCFPIVRVCDNSVALISRALDAGALGILAPMINNADDARRFVEQCRYAPRGKRSWGPSRALALGMEANDNVKVIAMIETREGIQNLESILDVEGLDGAFVGPCDLSISLGFPPKGVPTEPTVVNAIAKVLETCKKRGKLSMLYVGDQERARSALEEGWDAVFEADVSWISKHASEFAKAAHGL